MLRYNIEQYETYANKSKNKKLYCCDRCFLSFDTFSAQDVEILYENKQLGLETAERLQHIAWFNIMLHFAWARKQEGDDS